MCVINNGFLRRLNITLKQWVWYDMIQVGHLCQFVCNFVPMVHSLNTEALEKEFFWSCNIFIAVTPAGLFSNPSSVLTTAWPVFFLQYEAATWISTWFTARIQIYRTDESNESKLIHTNRFVWKNWIREKTCISRPELGYLIWSRLIVVAQITHPSGNYT